MRLTASMLRAAFREDIPVGPQRVTIRVPEGRKAGEVKLLDYKVRVLAANQGTESKVRVLIESGDHKDKWGTVGVSENIMEASWQALADSIEYKLLLKDR